VSFSDDPLHPLSFGQFLGAGKGHFLFATVSKLALGPTQPPIQWVPGALPWG